MSYTNIKNKINYMGNTQGMITLTSYQMDYLDHMKANSWTLGYGYGVEGIMGMSGEFSLRKNSITSSDDPKFKVSPLNQFDQDKKGYRGSVDHDIFLPLNGHKSRLGTYSMLEIFSEIKLHNSDDARIFEGYDDLDKVSKLIDNTPNQALLAYILMKWSTAIKVNPNYIEWYKSKVPSMINKISNKKYLYSIVAKSCIRGRGRSTGYFSNKLSVRDLVYDISRERLRILNEVPSLHFIQEE